VHIGFADYDCLGVLELCYANGVFLRDSVFEVFESGSRSYTSRVIEVFNSNRNPMQGPAPIAGFYLDFGNSRRFERRLFQNGDKGVQCGIQLLNTLKTCATISTGEILCARTCSLSS